MLGAAAVGHLVALLCVVYDVAATSAAISAAVQAAVAAGVGALWRSAATAARQHAALA
eukprot:gene45854-3152_t